MYGPSHYLSLFVRHYEQEILSTAISSYVSHQSIVSGKKSKIGRRVLAAVEWERWGEKIDNMMGDGPLPASPTSLHPFT